MDEAEERGKAKQIAQSIANRVFDDIDRIPESLALETLSSHSYIAQAYLNSVEKDHPECAPYVRKSLAGLL